MASSKRKRLDDSELGRLLDEGSDFENVDEGDIDSTSSDFSDFNNDVGLMSEEDAENDVNDRLDDTPVTSRSRSYLGPTVTITEGGVTSRVGAGDRSCSPEPLRRLRPSTPNYVGPSSCQNRSRASPTPSIESDDLLGSSDSAANSSIPLAIRLQRQVGQIIPDSDSSGEQRTNVLPPHRPRPRPTQRMPRPIPRRHLDSDSSDDDPLPRHPRRRRQNANPPPANPWSLVQPPEAPRVGLPFTARNVGPKTALPKNSPPIQYFHEMFSRDILEHIVTETNRYARDHLDDMQEWLDDHPSSRLHQWEPLTFERFKVWLGVLWNTGLNKKKDNKKHWDTRRTQRMPFFSEVMSRNEFQRITRFLHLVDNAAAVPYGEPGHDPWFKVRPILDYMNSKWKELYVPQQMVSLDESLIALKNRTAYIQYMPNKRHARFGIKKFELCESTSGYTMHCELYNGKDFFAAKLPKGLAHEVVTHIVRECRLEYKGYHLITDNFYTKVPLAEDLLSRDIMLTGTIRPNSRGLDKNFVKSPLGVGETLYYRKGDVLACKFKEKKTRKPVHLITTHAHAENSVGKIKNDKEIIKPVVIQNYNKSMGGVDMKDQKVYHVAASHATRRYWIKIFQNLLDMAILNSYICYVANTDKRNTLERFDFIEAIIDCLCYGGGDADASPVPLRISSVPLIPEPERHFFQKLPGRQERKCAVCSHEKTRGRSSYWCPGCNVGIHQKCWPELKHFHRPHGYKTPKA